MTESPLRHRAGTWLQKNPAWESWIDGQDEIRRQHNELQEQGFTVAEANARLGLVEDVDQLKEEFEKQLAERDQIIEAGRRQDVVKDHRIEELEKDRDTWKRRALEESRRTQFGRRR